ncbi:MAG: hypothetical protein WBM41_06515 [Arenicellales bacterium]
MPSFLFVVIKKFLYVGFALIAAITPGLTMAIGFGTPTIDSYIGQPLRVRVPLLSVQEGDLDELSVSLAAPTWYQAAGLDYPVIASQISLDLDLESLNDPAVLVTTENAINQVMLPVVLELKWPTRVMRNQLTVLLNPVEYQPKRFEEEVLVSDGLVEASGTAGTNRASTDDSQQYLGDSMESAQDEPPADTSAELFTQEADQILIPTPDRVVVKSGDSLSIIVDRYLPKGANRFQGRMAFYNANPQAFQNGEIHHLIQGTELEVPSTDTILGLSPVEAKEQYVELARVMPEWVSDPDEISQVNVEAENDGFRLSLIELAEAESGNVQADAGSRVLQSGQTPIPDVPASDSNGMTSDASSEIPGQESSGQESPGQESPRQSFAMQGFSMKLTVMNAYIVELQDENQRLKDRVVTLEQKVERLALQVGQDTGFAITSAPAVVESSNNLLSESDSIEDYAQSGISGTNTDIDLDAELNLENESSEQAESSAPLSEEDRADAPAVTAEQSQLVSVDGTDDTVAEQSVRVVQETSSPSVVFREGLIDRARSVIGPLNTPIVQLVLAILLLGFLLLAWMLRRDQRKKYREVAENEIDVVDNVDVEGGGVSYVTPSASATLDLDDAEEPWTPQNDMSEADLDNLQESAVDPITQSEVYLTYHRPQQAIEVLWEEYARPDSDKFVVAKRIIKAYKTMGDNEHRNASLRNFIARVNDDIELFSPEQWDELRLELDSLRKTEQTLAVESIGDSSSPYELEPMEINSQDERNAPELPQDVVEELDDGLIDLDYDRPDKVQTK